MRAGISLSPHCFLSLSHSTDHQILQALPLQHILKLSTCLHMHCYSLESGPSHLSPGCLQAPCFKLFAPIPIQSIPTQQLVGLLKCRFGGHPLMDASETSLNRAYEVYIIWPMPASLTSSPASLHFIKPQPSWLLPQSSGCWNALQEDLDTAVSLLKFRSSVTCSEVFSDQPMTFQVTACHITLF